MKTGLKKISLIAVCLVLLALLAACATFWLTQKSGATTTDVADIPQFIDLKPFTVSLQPEDGRNVLRATISIEAMSTAQRDYFSHNVPLITNRLVLLLSNKRASDISTLEGKGRLEDEMRTELQQPFKPGGTPQTVRRVIFSSFQIE
jgi:flagellar FliL protein